MNKIILLITLVYLPVGYSMEVAPLTNASTIEAAQKNILFDGTLSEITDEVQTWPKFISRPQEYTNCVLNPLFKHETRCKGDSSHIYNPTNLTAEQFLAQMKLFISTYPQNMNLELEGFHSYVEKHDLDPKTKLHIFGDLHADIHGFVTLLNKLKQKGAISNDFQVANGHRLVFLGDCGDRGDASCEVWALLMRLRIINQQKCIIARGNHELEEVANQYGFSNQIERCLLKRNAAQQEFKPFHRFFNYLPVAVFLGCKDPKNDHVNYGLFCHAAIEFGWNDHSFLRVSSPFAQKEFGMNRALFLEKYPSYKRELAEALSEEDRKAFLRAIKPEELEKQNPQRVGFQWNFYHNDGAEKTSCLRDKWTFSKQLSQNVMKSWSNQFDWGNRFKRMINACTYLFCGKRFLNGTTYSVLTNIRAHQHPGPGDFVAKSEQARIMRPLYTNGFGMLCHWEPNRKSYFPMPYYAVFTLKNNCCNSFGAPFYIAPKDRYLSYDNKSSMAHVTVDEKWQDWKLESEVTEIFTEKDLPIETQGKLINLDELDKLN